ncbi:leucine--tRNA ligase [Candidatus Roizmanbacteria bacterium CG09_land_8_20_14_0_10_41_9]|uniref:Leucine--tRNA ligase n=1 Tax=Candidatus Roizmanbacteria bacterium CG09_land_8_20_14_0_10_41_9 TaxID=1974850 RepID=A0A2H0WT92_9BACT|nr:MAG: leucine--tRNA ligase [Candidatus Roizmanbacteria bacterium CG09_land_8_20_14_0_10_41_9]
MSQYIPKTIEEPLVESWEKESSYKAKDSSSSKKLYVLPMFPYPSGAGLHVGHVRNYTGTDVLARFFRMNGYNVLHPIGWDAFGLPAENAAVKAKKNPMDMVPDNIKTFQRQMKRLGFSYDWSREFSTSDPEYYKWTQWLFIQFFKLGMLYKKEMPVYYCEFCKTGLAEEEVLPNGTHERCGKPIVRKTLPQWVFNITAYADRLLDDLEGLDWPHGILEMQKNWIGKSEGAEVRFKLVSGPASEQPQHKNSPCRATCQQHEIKVFTTRPDTLFGVTAVVLAPEHELVKKILKNHIKISINYYKDIQKYVEQAGKKLDLQRTDLNKEKTGVPTGLFAVNPVNGEKVPVWVADYVLGYYGYGAVMLVPAHDDRDFAFAKKYGLKIKYVISKNTTLLRPAERDYGGQVEQSKNGSKPYTGYGYMIPLKEVETFFEDSRFFKNPVSSQDFHAMVVKKLEGLHIGKRQAQYKLRDWIFSRQRYWGEPIPMVHCEKCGWSSIPEDQLPLELPYIKSYEPPKTGESPLSQVKSFVKTTCPNCGGEARRETDTMPNWAGSCWYFLAFSFWDKEKANSKSQIPRFAKATPGEPSPKKIPNPNNQNSNLFGIWNLEFGASIKKWLPVDWYVGGAEHAVLHLLYSRFWVKMLYDLKLVSFKEPFLRLRNQGMVLGPDHQKMSKSLGNVINPDDVVNEFGADTIRIYEMFMAPYNQEIAWSTHALQGGYRFLKRVWNLYEKGIENSDLRIKNPETKELNLKLNKTIKKVTKDIEELKFNTAIAAMMEFINEWEKQIQNSKFKIQNYNSKGKTKKPDNNGTIQQLNNSFSTYHAKRFLQILAPFAPFITEEIWKNTFKEKASIHLSRWPQVEEHALMDPEVVIPIQVNGKVRTVVKIKHADMTKESVLEAALKDEKIQKYVKGKSCKIHFVPGRIMNLIVT